MPAFVADAIGFERPLNTAWLLGHYRAHGGGMFIVAEGYWNFGFFGAGLIAAFISVTTITAEHWIRKQKPIMIGIYLALMGSCGFGLFYGLQGLARALEILIALALLLRLGFRFEVRRPRPRLAGNGRPVMLATIAR
jgi:hypothetical protein